MQTVTLESPTPDQNKFGQAVVDFQGAPDFSPTRIAEPGPTGFPLANFQPGAVAGPGYSPFIRIAGSQTVYSAPIVATGDGPFDVVHHTNTGDRVLGVHIAGPPAPGQFAESWVDLLFVKGFDAGQPIVYISTDAGQPLTSVLERSTYVPALDKAAYNGGDDFLGSARERLFGFINGQTGADNKESQGFVHLIKDGHASEDASAGNTALIDALRNGGDLLNVFGDFPTETDPRHARGLQPALGRPARALDGQGGQAGPEHAPDRRGAGLQPRRHAARPAHRRRPGDRPARSVRLGRRRHQLRGDRVHRQGPDGQPRRPRRRTRSSRPARRSNETAGPPPGPAVSSEPNAKGALVKRTLILIAAARCSGHRSPPSPHGTSSSRPSASPRHRSRPAVRRWAASSSTARGRTLYLFEKDTRGRSACSGACATYWPPLLTRGRPTARGTAARSRCSAQFAGRTGRRR